LGRLADSKWQERKSALEDLEKIIASKGGRIKMDGLYDLIA
jgi:hypothetical protein